MTPASATRPTSVDLRALLAPHEPPCIPLCEPLTAAIRRAATDAELY